MLPLWIENVRNHLSKPGQWYFDQTKKEVLYYPRPGERLAELETIIAAEETLVLHNGVSKQQWSGITFEFATWLRPMEDVGYAEMQSGVCNVCDVNGYYRGKDSCGKRDSGVVIPGNVVMNASSGISFDNCTFQHLGAFATSALGGSHDVAWRGCNFSDVSAGAVMLGQVSDSVCNETDVSKWDRNLTVADSRVFNLPVEYTGATAIFAAYVQGVTIEHNHIANTSYSSMTIGWGWGREGCGRGNNQIVANLVENPQRERCCDGGLVYTLGPQPGSSIERNHLRATEGSSGVMIFHDNGSGGFADKDNVLDGVFHEFCGLNPSFGPYGDVRQGQSSLCGPVGTPTAHADCNITFVKKIKLGAGAGRAGQAADGVRRHRPRQFDHVRQRH